MIRSRSQNSFLAVATLGVYLGLILAGATPSVLAQAATAKQFSVKDEVGRRDDLDNKPDGCDLLAAKVKEKHSQFEFNEHDLLAYAADLQETLQSYVKLHGTLLNVKWEVTDPDRPARYLEPMRISGAPVLADAKTRQSLEKTVLALSGHIPGTTFDFGIVSNGYDVITTATSSRHDNGEAHRLAIAYDAALDLYRCSVTNPSEKLILDNSEIGWFDDQVFITTRLPRGSLDTLLASNAK
ncbi:MAG TPA: hypothetical protein VGI80_03580 [Pyrinomonadaceae bacterium]